MKKLFLLLFCCCLIFNTGCNFEEMQAKMGDSEAKYNYAMKCKNNGDIDNYKFWLYESSEKGNKKAQLELAKYLTDKIINDKENTENKILDQKDIDLITKIADEGNSEIQYALGIMYWENKGVPKKDENTQKGFYYLDQAGTSDNDKALLYLGKITLQSANIGSHSFNITKKSDEERFKNAIESYERAIEYLSKAAYKGNQEASKLLEEAKEKLAEAQFNLSITTQDDEEAFNLLLKVAESDFKVATPAQHNLGVHYIYGKGCEENIDKAKYYFKKAAQKGWTASIEALEMIESQY